MTPVLRGDLLSLPFLPGDAAHRAAAGVARRAALRAGRSLDSPAMVDERQIEVNQAAVRRALTRSFTSLDPAGHAWRGTMGLGEAVVTADVLTLADGRPYVHVSRRVRARRRRWTADVARMLVIENANTVIGRLSHDGRSIQAEHAILAGTTMAAVEVQATVWTVGWTAISFAAAAARAAANRQRRCRSCRRRRPRCAATRPTTSASPPTGCSGS